MRDREPTDSWFYYRELHSVAAQPATRVMPGPALDLAGYGEKATTTSRALGASIRAQSGLLPDPLIVREPGEIPSDPLRDPQFLALSLDSRTGTVQFRQGADDVRALTALCRRAAPRCSREANIVRARQGGGRHGGAVRGRDRSRSLFSIPVRGPPCSEPSCSAIYPAAGVFALSRDGQRFARTVDEFTLEVSEVPGGHSAVLVTPHESLWIHFEPLGRSCLLISEFELGGPR